VNEADDGLLVSFRQGRDHLKSLPHPPRFAVVVYAFDPRSLDAEHLVGRDPQGFGEVDDSRRSYTGLDYADQRFYASTYGRFNTPDPYSGSATLLNPLSWNRYSYTLGDPVNGNDPTGECTLRTCLSQIVHVAVGVVQVGAGVVLIGAAAVGDVGTGGLATVPVALGALAGIGLVVSGATNIGAGITGDPSLATAASAVYTITNPAGLVTTIVTFGDISAGEAAANVYDGVTAVTGFYNTLENGSTMSTIDLTQGLTSPFTTGFSGVGTIATDYLDGLTNGPQTNAPTTPTLSGGSSSPTSVDGVTYQACQIYDIDPSICLGQN
jgi:RHS repeat-associated protein